jgi:hypothetical protein
MTNANPESPDATIHDARTPSNFLREMIAEDVRTKKYGDAVIQTRFPPEPNGYLHIGHAKAICIDFGLADEFGGKTNLRFDDTNPEKEEQEYVDSIMEDVRWLGFEWERLCYASDYFGQLYEWALQNWKSICRRPHCRRDSPAPRHADRARQGQSLSQSHYRRKPRPLSENEIRRVSRRLARAACQDRHGVAESESTRPGHVPHFARLAPAHRR